MTTSKAVILLGAAFLLAVPLIYFISQRGEGGPDPGEGTSLVVLVDFSKSFAATIQSSGRVKYGLHVEDERALKHLAGAVSTLATTSWTPPLKTIWNQIQSSSLMSAPICAPLETDQRLVKPKGSVGTYREILEVLSSCATAIFESSRKSDLLADYTDISGAVEMASQIPSASHHRKALVMLSDFEEDLPPGVQPAAFRLQGERVLLLHRPGTDESQDAAGYLARVSAWRNNLLSRGAKSCVAIPVVAATESRIRAALSDDDAESGTSLTILVDFKVGALATRQGETLAKVGNTLASLARDWPSPVNALWVSMGSSAFTSEAMAVPEFAPSLIKKANGPLTTVDEFRTSMEELAIALSNRVGNITATDVDGTVALTATPEIRTARSILVLLSDLKDSDEEHPVPFQLAKNTEVIFLHAASPSDRSAPNEYSERRKRWEKRMRQSGASSVTQISLISFSPGDLKSALGNNN
jgi:hypothetical protein